MINARPSHRIARIDDEIDEHLLELSDVHPDFPALDSTRIS